MNTEQEGIKSAVSARARSFETAECARDRRGTRRALCLRTRALEAD